MREINDLNEIYTFCKALSSPIRINIIKILMQNRMVNLNELAEKLGVTNGAVTSHIKAMHKAGVIDIEHSAGKRGIQKNCFLKDHKFLINTSGEYTNFNTYEVELPIGSYTRYNISPTCGLATKATLIGEVDDPRFFDDPRRTDAGILWYTKGFVEYRIPNYLKPLSALKEIQLSFEISSEAPGICDDWPSDIHFYLNEVHLGVWTSPGDFGSVKGLYTPDWWFPNWNQYGLLKLLTVNNEGTYIDGKKISGVKISDFNLNHKSDIIFTFAVPETTSHVGGMTLFGKGFGNYSQDIKVRVIYLR